MQNRRACKMPPVIENPVIERALSFDFQPGYQGTHFEKWGHHAAHDSAFNAAHRRNPQKVDVVALPSTHALSLWLIEAKDFRVITSNPKPKNITGLHSSVKAKIEDSLTMLTDAAVNASDADEKSYAQSALGIPDKRIVLHLEPHVGPHAALFPSGFSANVLAKLKQELHGLGIKPLVLNIANTPAAGVPWRVI